MAVPSPAPPPALFQHFPALERALSWVRLGVYPTPVQELPRIPWLPGAPPLALKREDLSSPAYGGNKVRTLEAHLGAALTEGATRVWATGAYGSNHVTATAIHAPRVGLSSGAMLFPQPPSEPARENLLAILARRPALWPLASVIELPFAMARVPGRAREPIYVMPPGGATPVGAAAHVGAALELAAQIAAGEIEPPERIVLAVGSTCTAAGLLLGVHLAARLGVGFRQPPQIWAVRVTPWPVTARERIAALAFRTSRFLAERVGEVASFELGRLRAGLHVDRRYFGRGYGHPTGACRRAIAAMRAAGGPELDVVYSAKSAAAFFEMARQPGRGPLLLWATKSTARLPEPRADDVARAPERWRRWLALPAY